MQSSNPYETPKAPLSTLGTEKGGSHGEINIFTADGRLGRLRYIMYTMGVGLLGGIIAMALMMIPVVGWLLGIAVYIGLVVMTFILTIQRCHDMNKTGWLSLIVLIPLVSLVFYFWPGTKGENDYGLQPPENSTAIKVGAVLVIVLFVLSIVAAIALPAYQDYVLRANS